MQEFQYIIDDKGTKKAVIIDLEKCADIWEDFHDALIVRQRRKEPRQSLNAVKKHLSRAGKLSNDRL